MEYIELFTISTSCLLYGFVATVIIMTVLYLVLHTINTSFAKGLPFYIAGAFLFILLNIQLSMLIGAVHAKGAIDAIEIHLTQLMEHELQPVEISATDSQYILDDIISKNPLIGVFVDTCNFAGHTTIDIAETMADTLRSYLTKYIWHRVLWSLLFIVVACGIAILFSKNQTSQISRRRSSSARLSEHIGRSYRTHRIN